LNNIVGFKPTRGLLSTTGVVPACRSLDCVSILANSCDDAATIFRLLAGFDAADPYSRKPSELPARPPITSHSFTFGVPRDADLEFYGNALAKSAFAESVQRMRRIGGAPVEIDFAPFARAAALLYAGPWVAERFLVARELLKSKPDAILPITRSILERGAHLTAAEAFSAMYELQSLRQLAASQWERMDLLLIPTTGTAYTVEQIERNPIELNSNLGRYTNFVNLMDLCAIAIPAGFGDENVPFGVSLVAPAGRDEDLLEIGDALHRSLGIGAGVGRVPLAPSTPRPRPIAPRARLAVVGAHLSGMPLNHQLTDRRASLVRASKTAPCYRLYALPGTTPPKPGLIRVAGGEGVSVELEIWEMSHEAFGSFVATIPAPLGIGQILLEDGTSVQGFLCESVALTGARDISSFGGWRAFMKAK
jgi:allophanate hydrolase